MYITRNTLFNIIKKIQIKDLMFIINKGSIFAHLLSDDEHIEIVSLFEFLNQPEDRINLNPEENNQYTFIFKISSPKYHTTPECTYMNNDFKNVIFKNSEKNCTIRPKIEEIQEFANGKKQHLPHLSYREIIELACLHFNIPISEFEFVEYPNSGYNANSIELNEICLCLASQLERELSSDPQLKYVISNFSKSSSNFFNLDKIHRNNYFIEDSSILRVYPDQVNSQKCFIAQKDPNNDDKYLIVQGTENNEDGYFLFGSGNPFHLKRDVVKLIPSLEIGSYLPGNIQFILRKENELNPQEKSDFFVLRGSLRRNSYFTFHSDFDTFNGLDSWVKYDRVKACDSQNQTLYYKFKYDPNYNNNDQIHCPSDWNLVDNFRPGFRYQVPFDIRLVQEKLKYFHENFKQPYLNALRELILLEKKENLNFNEDVLIQLGLSLCDHCRRKLSN